MTALRLESGARGAEVIFDDGKVNVLSAERLRELASLLETIDRSSPAFVFRSGRPAFFAAGADMAEMSRFGAREAELFAALGQRTFRVIESLPMPTVCLIDGDCFGGALDLSLAFDVRIATVRSRFAHPGAKLGIVTGFAGTVRLPRLLSRHDTARMMLANEPMTAVEAERSGLIDLLVDAFDGSELSLIDLLLSADRETLLMGRELALRAPRLPIHSLQLLARRLHDLYSGSQTWMS
jgi:enoyl-CoA hydratase